MHRIFTHFQTLTKIPHCSYHTEALKTYLITFAKEHGYRVETDSAGNILASKGTPKLALQAHYDMVCVGKAPDIKIVTRDGWMQAVDSTLGADNGMAVAMMMALMEEGFGCEFLFTADEEVGLIGANVLDFALHSRYMLNLDSEDEAEVYIGCAGGVDIFAHKQYRTRQSEKVFYRVSVSGLPGGHSGVEIHKNIPNAIKLFGAYCQKNSLEIVSIEAGERINSIPVHVDAIVATSDTIVSESPIEVSQIEGSYEVIAESAEVIDLLTHAPHGVLAYHEALEIPDRSVNLALMSLKEGRCEVVLSARAMDAAGLEETEEKIRDFFTSYGYDVHSEGKYPVWKPEINAFSQKVCDAIRREFGTCAFKAIHAGLECAVISSRYPDIKIASIGPNIRSPHSTHERVELASVERTYRVVYDLAKGLCG